VPRLPHEQLADRRSGEPSAAIQERVARARAIQARRFAGTTLLTNADMGPKELRQHSALDDATETLLGAAVRQMGSRRMCCLSAGTRHGGIATQA
jgi:magnesium chelatase family protein